MTLLSQWKCGLLIAAISFLPLVGASADGTRDALRTFGLIGTWSPDCSRDPLNGGLRLTFGVGFRSFSIRKVSSLPNHAGSYEESEVKSAILITEKKLEIISQILKSVIEGKDVSSEIRNGYVKNILLKVDNKWRLFSSFDEDGNPTWARNGYEYTNLGGWTNTGRDTQLFEKCLN